MCTFTQKHTQISFSSKLKQQKCHTIWKKSNPQTKICRKQAQKSSECLLKKPKNKQHPSQKPANPQKKPEFAGKPQGWQHCRAAAYVPANSSEVIL